MRARLPGSVLHPDEPDHDQVEGAQHDQPGAATEREAVQLIGDECAEDADGHGISPESVFEQRHHHENFDHAVGEQVERQEVLARNQVAYSQAQMVEDNVVTISRDFVLREQPHPAENQSGTHQPKRDPAGHLQHAVQAL